MPPRRKKTAKSKKRRPVANKKSNSPPIEEHQEDTNGDLAPCALDLLDKLHSLDKHSKEYKSKVKELKALTMLLKGFSTVDDPGMVKVSQKYFPILSKALSEVDPDLSSESDNDYSSESDTDYSSESDTDYSSESDNDYSSESDTDYSSESDTDNCSKSVGTKVDSNNNKKTTSTSTNKNVKSSDNKNYKEESTECLENEKMDAIGMLNNGFGDLLMKMAFDSARFTSKRYELRHENLMTIYMCKKSNRVYSKNNNGNFLTPVCDKCGVIHNASEVNKLTTLSLTLMIKYIVNNNIYPDIFEYYTLDDIHQRIEECKKLGSFSNSDDGKAPTFHTKVKTDKYEIMNKCRIAKSLLAAESRIKEKKPDIIMEMKFSKDEYKLYKGDKCIKDVYPILLHIMNLKEQYIDQTEYTILYTCASKQYLSLLSKLLLREVETLSSGDFEVMNNITGEKKKVMVIMTEVHGDTEMKFNVFETSKLKTIQSCKECEDESLHIHKYVYEGFKTMSSQISHELQAKATKDQIILTYNNIKIAEIPSSKVCQDFKDAFHIESNKSVSKSKVSTNSEESFTDCKCGFLSDDLYYENTAIIERSKHGEELIYPLDILDDMCIKIYNYMFKMEDEYEYLGFNEENLSILNNRFENLYSIEGYSGCDLNSFVSKYSSDYYNSATKIFVMAKVLPMLLHDFNQKDSILVSFIRLLGSVINNMLCTNIPYAYDNTFSLKLQIYSLVAYMEAIFKKDDITLPMHMLVHFISKLLFVKDIALPMFAASKKPPAGGALMITGFKNDNDDESHSYDISKITINKCNDSSFNRQENITFFYNYLNKNDLLSKNAIKEMNLLECRGLLQMKNRINDYMIKNTKCSLSLQYESINYIGFNPSSNNNIINDIQDYNKSFMLCKGTFPQLIRAHYFIEYNSKFYVIADKYIDCKISSYNTYFYVQGQNNSINSEKCVIPIEEILFEPVIVADLLKDSKIDKNIIVNDLSEDTQSNEKNIRNISRPIPVLTYVPMNYIFHNGITDIKENPFIHTSLE